MDKRKRIVGETQALLDHTSAKRIKPYFSENSFTLYQGDCVFLMSSFSPESVDMIFADPPYFLSSGGITCKSGRMETVDKGHWDKPSSPEKNHEFNIQWLSACRYLMKPDATIWVSGTSHVIFSVGYAMHQLGFRILNDIIWKKTNPPPNLGCRCFTHSTEIIIWAAKSKKSKHTFHYQDMKKEMGGKQMKNVWELQAPGAKEKLYGKHPTQKPISLLHRIISASTNKNNLILDPFNGSGTTGLVAYNLNRKYIGIDKESDFLDLTIRRFKNELLNP